MSVISKVASLSLAERIECHNIYCEHMNYPDDRIYSMDNFNDEMSPCFDPLQICFMMHYGSFNPHDDWYAFDGSGNLKSFATRYDIAEYCETDKELAEDIEENPADYDFYVQIEEDEEEA